MRRSHLVKELKQYDQNKGWMKRLNLKDDPDCIKSLRSLVDSKDEKIEDRLLNETELLKLGNILNTEVPEQNHLSENVFTHLRDELGWEPLAILRYLSELGAESPENFVLALKVCQNQTLGKLIKLLKGFPSNLMTKEIVKAILLKANGNIDKLIDLSDIEDWDEKSRSRMSLIHRLMLSVKRASGIFTAENVNKIYESESCNNFSDIDFIIKCFEDFDNVQLKPEDVDLILDHLGCASYIVKAIKAAYNHQEPIAFLAINAMRTNPDAIKNIAKFICSLSAGEILTIENIAFLIQNKPFLPGLLRADRQPADSSFLGKGKETVSSLMKHAVYADGIMEIAAQCPPRRDRGEQTSAFTKTIFDQLCVFCESGFDEKENKNQDRSLLIQNGLSNIATGAATLQEQGFLDSFTLGLLCKHPQNVHIVIGNLMQFASAKRIWGEFAGALYMLLNKTQDYIAFPSFITVFHNNHLVYTKFDAFKQAVETTVETLRQSQMTALCMGLHQRLGQDAYIYRIFGTKTVGDDKKKVLVNDHGDQNALREIGEFLQNSKYTI